MTHDEAYERLSLVQGVLDEIEEATTDSQLRDRMDDAAQAINDGIARLSYLMTGPTTDYLKTPKPL